MNLSKLNIDQNSINNFFDDIFNSRKKKKQFKRMIKNSVKDQPKHQYRVHQYDDLKILVNTKTFDFEIQYQNYYSTFPVDHKYLQRYIGHWEDPKAMKEITEQIVEDDHTLFNKDLFS